jgi:PAS domain-containing protein
MSVQKPLELILARNLLASISTPAFLVGEQGTLLFYNEAAAVLVGRRFEETGTMSVEEWTTEFGPFDDRDRPIPYDQIPLTIAVRDGRPEHGSFRIAAGSERRNIAASAIPIVGPGGATGAIVIFWPMSEEEEEGTPVTKARARVEEGLARVEEGIARVKDGHARAKRSRSGMGSSGDPGGEG